MTKQQHQRYPQVSPFTSAVSLPFVIIENEKFYPDRFYLNAPTGLSCYHPPSLYRHQGPVSVSISVAGAKHTAGRPTSQAPAPAPAPATKLCPCQIRQQKQQQPLFDRSKLVQSLDLKAAIIGTYSLDDPKTLTHEFPKLFQQKHPCGSQVPTLILHGVKDLERIFKGEKSCRVSAEEEYSKERELQAEDRELRELFREFLQKKQRQVHSLKDVGNGKYKGPKANIAHEVIEIIDDDDNDDDDIDNNNSAVDNNKAPKYKAVLHQKLVSSRETKRKDISLLAKLHNKKLFQMPSKNNLQSSSTTNSRKKMRSDEETHHKSNNHSFGEHVYFSKVQTKFLPPGKFHPRNIENHDTKRNGCMNHNIHNEQDDDIVVIVDSDSDDESGFDDFDQGRIHDAFGMRSEIARCRQNMQGVHHPKYMLLFEKSGSVVVVVSSANMTSQKSADASWIQRFPPCIIDSTSGGGGDDFHDVPVQELRDRCNGSDFGHVLADFLQKQSEGVEEGEILPIQFLRKYVGRFDTLEDFRKTWRFDSAIVHLVSTVPGYHPGRFTTEHLAPLPNGCRRILYGPQRVADILYRLGGGGGGGGGNTSRDSSESNARKATSSSSSSGKEHQRHWLPRNVLSDNDRLIIQTTSFGAKWTSRHLEELARQHMGYDGPHNDNDTKKKDGKSLLDKVDIIWPSMSYLESIRQIYEESSSPGNAHDFHHFLFLRSEGFNSSDLAVCSQMKLLEDSCPLPLPLPLTPHIKTYARLLDCTDDDFCKRHYHRLAWVMLSSACFSRGAQGYTLTKRDSSKVPPPVISKRTEEDMRAYSNFELGILFVSRLQGNPDTDRIYVSYNTRTPSCQCDKNVTSHQGERLDHDRTKNTFLFPKDHVKEIPMPFPFCLTSRPYQLDQEDAVFSETPFFHQMTRDSISSGFCSLTPFGQWCSSRFSTSTHNDGYDQKK